MENRDFSQRITQLFSNIAKVIVGKNEVINLALVSLFCKGHLLIEDVPGLGKTILARAIAKSLNMAFKRIQFTPDLLPSDITGVFIFNQKTGEFQMKPGPIFTNILLADEINRTTPRTQSSLLEAMEEFQVTVDGKTYQLPKTFFVIATQNPIELQGTYPLPEAQLDRFFMRLSIGYPGVNYEVKIMEMQAKEHPIHSIGPVMNEEELIEIQEAIKDVYVDKSIKEYIVRIMDETRNHPHLLLGASPRGSLALMRASQALSLIRGKDFVEPYVVKNVVFPILAHRLIIKPQSRLSKVTEVDVISDILKRVKVPIE